MRVNNPSKEEMALALASCLRNIARLRGIDRDDEYYVFGVVSNHVWRNLINVDVDKELLDESENEIARRILGYLDCANDQATPSSESD